LIRCSSEGAIGTRLTLTVAARGGNDRSVPTGGAQRARIFAHLATGLRRK